jgi:hypothetical protein
MIKLGVYFHMNPNREWFCEYEKYNGGDVFLRDESTSTIIGSGKVKLLFDDGRIRTLPRLLHVLVFDRNLISIIQMSCEFVHVMFEMGS